MAAQLNPMEQLQPAWQRFKRSHAAALRELRKSHRFEGSAIRAYCFTDAVGLDREARMEWKAAIRGVLGIHYKIEWIGDAANPACLVNGVMMFS